MRVGDLVTLSAYGRSRQYNGRITKVDPHQVGIITHIDPRFRSYPYKVRWMKDLFFDSRIVPKHSRRELKRAYR